MALQTAVIDTADGGAMRVELTWDDVGKELTSYLVVNNGTRTLSITFRQGQHTKSATFPPGQSLSGTLPGKRYTLRDGETLGELLWEFDVRISWR